MVVSELLQDGMVIRHYSDQGMMIRKAEDGSLWPDAIDVVPCQFTYEETDILIEDVDLEPQEALDIILGVVE